MDPYIARLFQIESGGNPNAVTGSNRGLGQFGPGEEAQFGLNDQNRTDPIAQAAAVQREAALHSGVLGRALGRPPTPGELYLAHQQGIAGGPALLTGGNTPAWQAIRPYYKSDAMAQKAISGNLPAGSGIDPATATADQFAKFWVSKFEGGQPAQSAPLQAIPPAAPPSGIGLFGAQMAGGAPAQQGAPQQQGNPLAALAPLLAPGPQPAPMPMFQPPRQPVDMSRLYDFLNAQKVG
jgi:hypothetical protein